MNTIKNIRISEWLKVQKIHMKAHKSDIDLDIITLNKINFEKNPLCMGASEKKERNFSIGKGFFMAGWMSFTTTKLIIYISMRTAKFTVILQFMK